MLEIRSLVKEFPGETAALPALGGVDLMIGDGEFFAILGPSGCGKTTLLRLLAGFETPTAGMILEDGARIDHLAPNRRSFNMVFQRYALFPHLTVSGNVEFGLRMKKVALPEIRSRVAEALALVRLEGFENRAIATLSGGQQQRVALARALVNRPRVLLLDEPLSALDLKLRQEMQVELRAIQRKVKQTFVFVTHDQEEALALADRIAVMNRGRVEQVGSSREIYDRPRTAFVARFIGSANFWSGTLRTETGKARFRFESGREIDVVGPVDTLRGDRVSLMIRPERIRLETPQADGRARSGREFVGFVRDAIYHGSFVNYVVECSELAGAPALVALPCSAATAEIRAGEKVAFSWEAGDGLLLADESSPEVPGFNPSHGPGLRPSLRESTEVLR